MKTTKSSLVERNATLETENTALACALADTIRGDVKWFKASRFVSYGITRPSSACGGIVIVNNGGTVSAHYLEAFGREALAHISLMITGENTDHNRELLARREAIESALAYARQAMMAA